MLLCVYIFLFSKKGLRRNKNKSFERVKMSCGPHWTPLQQDLTRVGALESLVYRSTKGTRGQGRANSKKEESSRRRRAKREEEGGTLSTSFLEPFFQIIIPSSSPTCIRTLFEHRRGVGEGWWPRTGGGYQHGTRKQKGEVKITGKKKIKIRGENKNQKWWKNKPKPLQ